MTAAQAPGGEKASPPGSVDDQGLGRIVRTGRGKPAVAPDQQRKRQLVGAVRRPDDAFVEGHAGEVANEGSASLSHPRKAPIKPRRRG